MESQLSKFSKLSFLVAVLFGIGLIRLWPHYDANAKFPEHPEAIHLARSLAFHHQFADPFRLVATGPSAYLSPAFPSFLALLIRVFGTGAEADFAFRLAAAMATAAQLALLPLLTEIMGIRISTGILACAVGLLPPILTFPDWEMSYAGLLIVLATILFWIVLTKPQAGLGASALLGFVSGLLLLTSASVLPVLTVWFGYGIWKFRSDFLRRGRWAAAAIVLVMLTPWIVRNYLVFHRFIPFRTALGLALEASNNDCALVGVRQSEANGCFGQHSPNHNFAEAVRARDLGEPEYTSEKFHETLQWVKGHPRRFLVLTCERIVAFWLPHESDSLLQEFSRPNSRRKERLMIYLGTILSLPGLVLMLRFRREAGLILGAWLVFFPPVYYIALFEDRYRYPILWVTLVFAGYAIRWAATKLPDWHRGKSAAVVSPT